MFVLRFFGGPLANRLSPLGLLMLSSILSAAGLLGLSAASSPVEAFGAATVFGAGKIYFWPTMLGVASERFPRGGSVLLALMGGAGNLAAAFVLPIMGGWYDHYDASAAFRYVAVWLAFSQSLSESFSSTIGPREAIKRLEFRQTCE